MLRVHQHYSSLTLQFTHNTLKQVTYHRMKILHYKIITSTVFIAVYYIKTMQQEIRH